MGLNGVPHEPCSEEERILVVLMPYGGRTSDAESVPPITPNIVTLFFILARARALRTEAGSKAFLVTAIIIP